jgi:trimethylamine--corrinoid protein Co-methyltransferase
MQARFNVLSSDEQQRIHQAALAILAKVGLRINSLSLFNLLQRAGLPSDTARHTVCFPRSVVTDALNAAPKHWIRRDQNGYPLPPPSEQPYFVARVLLNQVLDFGAQKPRPPQTQDIVNLIRLAGSLPKSHIVYKVDCPCNDLPEDLNYLETIATVYKNTSKHILANPIGLDSTRYYVELAEVVTEKPIREQACLLCGIAVTSPLTLDKDSAESLLFLLQKGAPVNCFGMPIAGASAPLTLAGTLAQHTAEVLALVSITQLIARGTPVAYGGMSTTLNLRTGNLSMAAPAVDVLTNAATTMARFYGLPAYNAANYTDASGPDVQCGVEKAISAMVGMAAGSDVGMFGGDLHDAMTISYEQLLIDYDIWEAVSRLLRGIRVDSDTLAEEAIERVGHSGGWLTDPHTLAWLRRDEHAFGQFFVRGEPAVQKTMLHRAHERVAGILSEDYTSPVPAHVIERIDAFVAGEKDAIRRRKI